MWISDAGVGKSGLAVLNTYLISFAEGQNGPTHQPVEVDSLFRAMPNLCYIRPCNAEEVIGAWIVAMGRRDGPTMISLAKDPTTGTVPDTKREKVAKGAYVVVEMENHQLTLASCGLNLHHAVTAGEALTKSGIPTRVVGFPSFALFDQQDTKYRESVFPTDGTPIVSVEEYVATGWAKYVTASIGMTGYGYSAEGASNYERFGLNAKGIEDKVRAYLEGLEQEGKNARMAGWRQLYSLPPKSPDSTDRMDIELCGEKL